MSETSKEQINKVVEGCIKGDRKSQQVLYMMFYGKMLGVCMRYSKDSDEAKDVLQEGFIKVFMNINKFGASGSFEGWVRKIMVNTAIDFYRKNKHSVVQANSEYVEANGEEAMTENENGMDYSGINTNEIMEAVQKLSPVYRTVFSMYVIDGYSHKEIAAQLGINEGTSKSNLSKAKTNLKKAFAGKIKLYQEN
ncbi:MAG: sigma-70 family RNA polymerase sigma factor [Bacteroidetes bacterium]|nr:sigma-70 family RNA polymerase sigma factor [Bacteroidota bacterium]